VLRSRPLAAPLPFRRAAMTERRTPMQLPLGLTGDTGGGSKHGQQATHQQPRDFGQAECLTVGAKESAQDEPAVLFIFYIRTMSVALNNLQTRTPPGVSMDADTLSSEVEITAERSTALPQSYKNLLYFSVSIAHHCNLS